jgi:hypothetical protein
LRALHDRAQLAVCFLALPASVGLIVLAQPICSVLFEHGNYTADGVGRASGALAMLSLSILPTGAIALTSRAYYALGDFKTPVRIAVLVLVCNTLLNFVFVRGLGMDADGFALGTSISSWVNLALLWPGLHARLNLPATQSDFGARLFYGHRDPVLRRRGLGHAPVDHRRRRGHRPASRARAERRNPRRDRRLRRRLRRARPRGVAQPARAPAAAQRLGGP